MTTSIKIVAFRAIDHPGITENIFYEHTKRLMEYNVTGLINSDAWLTNPFVYCVFAIDEERNKILGAIRIHIADLVYRMPMEYALRQFNINIQYLLKNLMHNTIVAESCGLWCVNEPLVKKAGLSLRLIIFHTALCTHLNVFHFFAFPPNHTLDKFYKMGFTKHELFFDYFHYPNQNYQSRVMHIMPSNLENTDVAIRHQILAMRENSDYVERLEFEDDSVIIKYQSTLLKPQYVQPTFLLRNVS